MQLLPFLRSICGAIYYESSKRSYSVMRVGDWRAQKKVEKEASLYESHTSHIMVDWFVCDLCNIGIGPNHEEQHVFLFPVYNQKVKLHGEGLQSVKSDILRICGDCASWKSYQVPEWLCCIGPWAWETDEFVSYYQQYEEKRWHPALLPDPGAPYKEVPLSRREAANIHVEVCEWLLLFIYCLAWNISIRMVWNAVLTMESQRKEKDERLPITGPSLSLQTRSIFTSIVDPGFGIAWQ